MPAPDPTTVREVVIAIGERIGKLKVERKEPAPELVAHARALIEVIQGQGGTEADTASLTVALEAYARRNGRAFHTRAEVARMSGLSLRTIGRKVAAGEIRETPLGIPVAELERLAQGRKEHP